MKIYISIPITGHDYDIQKKQAEQIAALIKAAGHEPVSPFETPAAPSWMEEPEQYAYYMGEDIQALLLCGGIYLSKGWKESKGCLLEQAAAEIYGLYQFTSINKIPGLEDL